SYRSTGQMTATNVSITDNLPSGLTYVTGSGNPAPAISNGKLSWNLGDLPLGRAGTVTFQGSTDSSASGTIHNYAYATWQDQSGTQYFNSAEAQTQVAPRRQVVWVHGINENFQKILLGSWDNLLRPIQQRYSASNLVLFPYFQDSAYALNPGPGGCDSSPVTGNPPPDLRGKAYIPVNDGTSSIAIDQCDSESDLGLNATKLDDTLRAVADPQHDTAVMGYSMGGAIIRGWMALAQRTADPTLNHVDTAIFVQGAQQGSYLAGYYASALHHGIFDAPVVGGLAAGALARWGVHAHRPAIEELAPQSAWYTDPGLGINTQSVPPNLHYFNFYSDIGLKLYVSIGFKPVEFDKTLAQVGFGDTVLLPGQDSPTATPADGGARFLPGGVPAPDRYQWSMPSQHSVNVASPFSAKSDASGVLDDPRTHLNLSANFANGVVTVADCQTGQQVTPADQILSILANPAHACG
ncbi:MAG: hypothetical protein ACRDFX_14055, partial [Chloroflexota bacterium]